eukprot:jgi/Botrbrau1/8985/Bobra.0148s0091.1
MPSWQLPLEETAWAPPASPCPLYLGSIPSRPAEMYAALLATRPQALGKGAFAIMGLGLGTAEPLFTLVIHGEPAVTLGAYNSLLHIIYMFLKVVKQEMGGCIAGRSLSYLQLHSVLDSYEV